MQTVRGRDITEQGESVRQRQAEGEGGLWIPVMSAHFFHTKKSSCVTSLLSGTLKVHTLGKIISPALEAR